MKVREYIRNLSDSEMDAFFTQGVFNDYELLGHTWCDKRRTPVNFCTGVDCKDCTKLFMESDVEDLIRRINERKALFDLTEDDFN